MNLGSSEGTREYVFPSRFNNKLHTTPNINLSPKSGVVEASQGDEN